MSGEYRFDCFECHSGNQPSSHSGRLIFLFVTGDDIHVRVSELWKI